MMSFSEPIHGRLRASSILVMIGLLMEAVCLSWLRPIAFVIFVGASGLLIAAGILLFLFSLVSVPKGASSVGDDRLRRSEHSVGRSEKS